MNARLLQTAPRHRIDPADLSAIAVDALRRMYRPEERLFAFRLRRRHGQIRAQGISPRYTATVLLGLAGQSTERTEAILGDHRPDDLFDRLFAELPDTDDLGQVAMTLWAARAWDDPSRLAARLRLKALRPDTGAWPTVELAWALAALSVDGPCDVDLAAAVAARLRRTADARSALFAHHPPDGGGSWIRRPIACFADQVYPIQALSMDYLARGDGASLAAARRCAEELCGLQGLAGQWWWHYDVRTGNVVEGYPVYSVHQDSMAVMALRALSAAGGPTAEQSIARGMRWLEHAPEIDGSLIDRTEGLIWRKVARHEPAKFVRQVQATTCRIHPNLRTPGVGLAFPPHRVDYETRPYHMGWILYVNSK